MLPDKAGVAKRFSRPTVSLNPDGATGVRADQPVRLSAKASPDAGRVEYYYDWHFAGESSDARSGFTFTWDVSQTLLKPGDEVRITAIAYDQWGESSLPTPGGEVKLRVAASPQLER